MTTLHETGSSSTNAAETDRLVLPGHRTRSASFGLGFIFRYKLFLGGLVILPLIFWSLLWGAMIMLANRPTEPLTFPYVALFLAKNHPTFVRQILDCGASNLPQAVDGRNCAARPAAEPFSSVALRVRNDVTEIHLQVRENAITVRDLSLVWGAPYIQMDDEILVLAWRVMGVQVFAQAQGQQIAPFLPVQGITISVPSAPF